MVSSDVDEVVIRAPLVSIYYRKLPSVCCIAVLRTSPRVELSLFH
jgi:hypothetical protein